MAYGTSRLDRLKQDQARRGREERERAEGITERVDTRRAEFDAGEAARAASGQAFEDYRERLGEDISDLRGEQVSRGRLDTGFAFEDEDRLVRDSSRELSRELVRNAFTATGMNLRNLEGMSGEATESRTRADDILVGRLDREQAAENQRRQRKRSKLGFLGGVAGAGLGFLAGGPAGAAAGAKIGGGAASLFG